MGTRAGYHLRKVGAQGFGGSPLGMGGVMSGIAVRALVVACAVVVLAGTAGCGGSQSAQSEAPAAGASVETTQSKLAALRSVPPSAPIEGPAAFTLVPVEEVGKILGIEGIVLGQPGTG